jgi:uncharacterized membrane protein
MWMTTLQWLLALHVTGAFLFLGGTVVAGAFGVLALRQERPSGVALFLGLARVAVGLIVAGAALTLVLGLWLVQRAGYSYGQFWIVASIVLLIASSVAGKQGGERDARTRELALQLAAEGDEPSSELRGRLRDRVTLALSWGAGAGVLAILALMVWKPGA